MSETGFDVPLDLRAHAPGEWVVLAAMRYVPRDGRMITVPAGFVTDLASIPALLRSVYNVNDASRQPAVLHDWLYCSQQTSRAEADSLFLEALDRAGVGWLKRRSMWLGVRAGGWLYWGKREGGLEAGDFSAAGGG